MKYEAMTTATQPGYELKLFGTPQLSVDGEPVRLTRRKAVALVAYLALSDRPQTRERLAALLWPEKQSARALASLRTVIHEITGLADILEIDQDLLSVKHDQCRVDVREFLELITKVPKTVAVGAPGNGEDRSEWIEAVDLYTDEFLRGFGLRDAPEFDDWIFFTAESLQTRLASSLASLVEHLTSIDTTAAILHAQRLVQIEELDEDNHRTLIELYVTEGRYSADYYRGLYKT